MTQILENLSLIAATTQDGGIGSENRLPWKCPEDMKFFKEFTTGKSVIMGHNTFESIGSRALPNRDNYVVTRHANSTHGSLRFMNFDSILELVKLHSDKEFIVIGGEKTYAAFMKHISKAYITTIKDSCVYKDMEIDTFLPSLSESFFLQGVLRSHDTCVIRKWRTPRT